MLFPSQTSLMPAQVALLRFWESQGFSAIFKNYPYWYLGTTPYRFLIGPVLPIFASILHMIFPGLSLFEIFFIIIFVGWVLGALGVYFLVRELELFNRDLRFSREAEEEYDGVELKLAEQENINARKVAFLAAFFYAFGFIIPFFFRFTNGISLLSFCLLPFVFTLYLRFIRRLEKKPALFLILFTSFVVLIDSSVISSVLLGMTVILLLQIGRRDIEKKIKLTILLLFLSFLILNLWYTPNFWLVGLASPSLAGRPRWQVLWQLTKLLPTALALVMAVFSLGFYKRRNAVRDFCFYWLFVFGFLTVMRYIADPDFWLDWSSYNLELQFGLAVLGGLLFRRWKKRPLVLVCSVVFAIWMFILGKYAIGTLQKEASPIVEYKIGSVLAKIVKPKETVFLSGTTAFWLNAFFDIPQVRGGVDQVSVHPDWRKAVWEVREGSEAEKSLLWLRELNVSWLVVHTKDSKEYYHDFNYWEKFEGSAGFQKVYENEGDRIYKIEL